MSYAAAIDQLNAMTPELVTAPGQPRRKFSLDQVHTLLAALGDPQSRFPSVLIAGTNGKGSTASTLASILTASGFRTGLYTSPHLEGVNERIRIDGRLIPDDDFARHFFTVHDTGESLARREVLPQHPSFFESLTALAFLYFAEQAVDIAILEVGMGGRLDATNVVTPLLSVITDISLDHTEWLGPTIDAIAREKAGILRPHGILVTLPQHPEANQALGEVATALDVRGVPATPYMPPLHADPTAPYPVEIDGVAIEIASPLAGAHQHRNVALAIAAALELRGLLPAHLPGSLGKPSSHRTQDPASKAELPNEPALKGHDFSRATPAAKDEGALAPGGRITPATIAAGIRNTSWPGRLELLSAHAPSASHTETPAPTQWLLDVAHNPAGAWALRAALNTLLHLDDPGAAPATLVFSCLRDKPLNELAQILFPLFARVVFAPIHSARAASMDDLLAAAALTGTPARAAASVAEALALAAAPELTGRETQPAPPASSDKLLYAPGPVSGHDFNRAGQPAGQSRDLAPAPHADSSSTASGSPSSTPATEREAPPARRAVVVSGSVYLVGEARALLLQHDPGHARP